MPIQWASLGLVLIAVTSSSCCFPCASSSRAFPKLCPGPGSRAPVVLPETLAFCGHSGSSCCSAMDDAMLMEEFKGLNVSHDAGCTDIVKAILCERCIPSGSVHDSFNTAAAAAWTTANAKSKIPPRCASLSPASPTSAAAGWGWPQQQGRRRTMCLERIGEGSYLNMAAHPDGSARAFFSTQEGKIWLATVPAHGSGDILRIHDEDDAIPFLDLTDRVLHMVCVALHPEFATNGRFFVSYTCDSTASPTCINSAAAAAAAASSSSSSSRPWQYQLVVAEFFAKYKATRADPYEVRRIFTMGLPRLHASYSYQQHGGQILFRPSDGRLYLVTGNGGQRARGHQLDSSKNKRSFLGKVIRFDVDRVPVQSGGSTPTVVKPEIFATGLSNPMGCNFDSAKPSYFYCANVNGQQHEEVLLISRSGNYSNYSSSSVINTASLIIDHGPAKAGSTLSIAGGVVYQGSADPALRGRYLYMYAFAPWTAVESPVSSGHYTSVSVPNIRCSLSTPVPCLASGGIGGRVVSFGEDNSKDAFVLATGGVYRVVWPGLCGGFDGAVYQPVQPAADYTLLWFIVLPFTSFLVLYHLYMMIKKMNPCGGQTATHNWECFRCCGNVNCCSDVTNNSY